MKRMRYFPSRITGTVVFLFIVCFWLLLVISCSRKEHSESVQADQTAEDRRHNRDPAQSRTREPGAVRKRTSRVYMIGIDGATWPVFEQLIARDLMPNLGWIVENGSKTVLKSIEPTASPIIWTTIATGKMPDQHGIRGFISTAPDGTVVPTSATQRRVKALWNIAGDYDVPVGFLSWWVTWPAEPVRGFLCSDFTWPLKKDQEGFATGVEASLDLHFRTYPSFIMEELTHFIVTEKTLPQTRADELGISAIPQIRAYAVREILLKDISIGEMGLYLLNRYRPVLFAVYFDGFDAFSHIFWPHYKYYLQVQQKGEAVKDVLPTQHIELCRALDLHMQRIDDYIGSIARICDQNDVLIILSDHGYGDNPGNKPIMRTYNNWIAPSHWHNMDGILAMCGGPIVKGASVATASVLDITPTVLALLNIPVAQDMKGDVLFDLLTPEFKKRFPVQYISSHETEQRNGKVIHSPFKEAFFQQLKSLGYIDEIPENP